MIEFRPSNTSPPHQACLILKPNCSASWRFNKQLIVAIGLLSAVIAGGFAAIGAWLILPFAGLEIAALSAALYWVNWHLHYRQVLWFEEDKLVIEEGYYKPRQSYRWAVAASFICVTEQAANRQALAIYLASGSERVRLGEFLTDDDQRKLLTLLRQLGLQTRSYSPDGDLSA